ncbi:GTP pyrophosphokinase family protein [Actinoplanes sp. NPDC051851]|uniref:GTP pyrophosphokinase n=1 Tax=Actinoplanes sp. NPDC051851 TaxID=3154753 RepID=UPI00343E6837
MTGPQSGDQQVERWQQPVEMREEALKRLALALGAGHAEHDALHELMTDLNQFLMVYKFGLAEIETKINILAEELAHRGRGNPIEHVRPRLKTAASIAAKARRTNCPVTLDDLRARIRDIAGVRIVCSFVSDVYRVADMLIRQPDVKLVLTKDYIAQPKPNGYRSLHLIVEIPVFMSDRVVLVPVEIQLRTVAMDFWASLEHKIYYKYDPVGVPTALRDELLSAAEDAAKLDRRMESLHQEIHGPRI